jgi:uncharacterized membrane protein
MLLATIRPDSWNFPLLLHVGGAMLLVGSLLLGAMAMLLSWRNGEAALVRLGYRALLFLALPSYIVMRVGAEWIISKEYPGETPDVTWLNLGYPIADGGGFLLLVAIILTAIAIRRRTRAEAGTSGIALGRGAAVLASVATIAYLVAVWAMATKPS